MLSDHRRTGRLMWASQDAGRRSGPCSKSVSSQDDLPGPQSYCGRVPETDLKSESKLRSNMQAPALVPREVATEAVGMIIVLIAGRWPSMKTPLTLA